MGGPDNQVISKITHHEYHIDQKNSYATIVLSIESYAHTQQLTQERRQQVLERDLTSILNDITNHPLTITKNAPWKK